MLAAGDADHRYYQYPGLFFYLLAIPVGIVRPDRIDDPAAYLAARALVACFGVAAVALVYRLGSRLAGAGVGLVAALLLAVSPHEVRLSHGNRPDVVLQAACLLGYLSLLALGRDRRGDLGAGLAIGAATAIKFNGFLLYPCYALARLLTPGPRLERLALVALVSGLTVLAATPYALLHLGEYFGGVGHQMGAHYQEPISASLYLSQLGTYLGWLVRSLGPLGTAASLLGAGLALRGSQSARRWAPLLLHVPLTLLVMASAEIVGPRFLIPAMGPLFLSAGLAVVTLARGRLALAVALALLTAWFPFADSLRWVRPLLLPTARDGALDWIEANLPSGATVLETRAEAVPELRAQLIGVDPRRYERLLRTSAEGGLELLAPHVDLAITGPAGGPRWSRGLETAWVGRLGEQVLFQLKRPLPGARPRYLRVVPEAWEGDAVAERDAMAALFDSDTASVWRTPGALRAGDWLELRWPAPQPLSRVELLSPWRPTREPSLELLTLDQAGAATSRLAVPARAPLEEQPAGRPLSQVFLLHPRGVYGLRLHARADRPEPWGIAELRLGVRAASLGDP